VHFEGVKEMSQNTFCSKCHRTPNQCCCNTAPRELSDDEIVALYESSYLQSGLDEWEFDPVYFARAILKKASEK
jgi:hypothetical protein